MYMRRFISNK